jgi:hypothetical protein
MSSEAHDVVEALAAHEDALGELYSVYSFKFPKESDFWHRLSSEEHSHAQLLRNLAAKAEGLHVFVDVERFDLPSIRGANVAVAELIAVAEGSSGRLREALLSAIQLEEAIIESKAFTVFSTDAPAVRATLDDLREQSSNHRRRLVDKLESL